MSQLVSSKQVPFCGFRPWIGSLAAVAAMLAGTTPARADFTFVDFSDVSSLTLNGDATQAGSILRVASAVQGQSGSAWYTAPTAHVSDGFDTTFTFRMGDSPDDPDGADGLAFVIQNESDGSLGEGGSGMGFQGITSSLAVKFDTFGFDTEPNNYISVQSMGNSPNSSEFSDSLGYVVPDTDLNDGNQHNVRIRYVPGTLDVFLDDLDTPILTVAIDLQDISGDDILDGSGNAWVGFTAGTGLLSQNHDIYSWNFVEGIVNEACACQNATSIDENSYFSDTNVGSPSCPGADCGKLSSLTPGKTYVFTASQGGEELINTYNNVDFDTFISVHSGCPLTAANQITCSNDENDFGAQVVFCVEQGHTYYVRVAGVAGATGNFNLLTILFTASITDGPYQNPANGHWYYSAGGGPWGALEQLGVSKGGHLASISNAAENEWVRSNFAALTGEKAIGINDAATEGTFVWSSGEPVVYTNWQGGVPNNSATNDYGVMADDGTWNEQDNCSAGGGGGVIEVNTLTLPGILAGPIRNPANCHDYYFTQPATWIEAQLKAQALGGNLVTINNAAENEFVRTNFANYLGNQQPVWIGFNDVAVEGTFVWVDGSPVAYTNWDPGEPNNLGNEDYGMMVNPTTGTWNDAHSGGPFSGVIEIPTSHCPCQCRLGDMNCDDSITTADIPFFVQALLQPAGFAGCNINLADMNGDSLINGKDIRGFINAVLTGP